MAKLRTYVHIDGRAYGPEDTVPAAVAAKISNPDVWDGPAPARAGSGIAAQPGAGGVLPVTLQEKSGSGAHPAADAGSDVPPKGGAGSGKDAWAAYAAKHDVKVADDATRDDIVAALDAAGVPTE